jgi:hypothetical protein
MLKKIIPTIFILIMIGYVCGLAQEGVATQPDKKIAVKPKQEKVVKSALTIETELCTGIEERMPTGMAESFSVDVGKVFLWCRVLGAEDSTMIQIAWYCKDEHKATVELPVRSSSWRTWSSKSFLPEWTGDWEVKVLDAGGKELKSIPFKIVAAQPVTE